MAQAGAVSRLGRARQGRFAGWWAVALGLLALLLALQAQRYLDARPDLPADGFLVFLLAALVWLAAIFFARPAVPPDLPLAGLPAAAAPSKRRWLLGAWGWWP